MSLTILIIEDDSALSGMWHEYLTKRGFNVIAALKLCDGIEAMNRIPHPDLVLLDLHLPDSPRLPDTLECIRRDIKRIHPEAIVAVATGHATPEISQLAFDHGADAFLNKLDISTCEELLDAVCALIYKHRGSGTAAAERTIGVIEQLSAMMPSCRAQHA